MFRLVEGDLQKHVVLPIQTFTLRCPPSAGVEGWQVARPLCLDHASRLPRLKAGVAPQHEGSGSGSGSIYGAPAPFFKEISDRRISLKSDSAQISVVGRCLFRQTRQEI